jgi:hypothetical protein
MSLTYPIMLAKPSVPEITTSVFPKSIFITSNNETYGNSAHTGVGGEVIVNMPSSFYEHNSSNTFTVVTVEPIIEGTAIPLYRISALLDGGMSVKEILEDFPSLTAKQVAAVRDYAKLYPNYWNPYPTKSFKRLLRSAGFYDSLKKVKKNG